MLWPRGKCGILWHDDWISSRSCASLMQLQLFIWIHRYILKIKLTFSTYFPARGQNDSLSLQKDISFKFNVRRNLNLPWRVRLGDILCESTGDKNVTKKLESKPDVLDLQQSYLKNWYEILKIDMTIILTQLYQHNINHACIMKRKTLIEKIKCIIIIHMASIINTYTSIGIWLSTCTLT